MSCLALEIRNQGQSGLKVIRTGGFRPYMQQQTGLIVFLDDVIGHQVQRVHGIDLVDPGLQPIQVQRLVERQVQTRLQHLRRVQRLVVETDKFDHRRRQNALGRRRRRYSSPWRY